MKLVEFYEQAGADKTDPLMSIVKNMQREQAKLKELRKQTQNYLIPIPIEDETDSSSFTVEFDSDCLSEIEDLANNIDTTKSVICDLHYKVTRLDEILTKYKIDKPLLNELQRGISSGKRSIEDGKAKCAGILGRILLQIQDEAAAKQHPKYLKAVQEYESKKTVIEALNVKREQVLSELEAVLKDGTKTG